jgi:hypothetical protein
MKTILRLRIFTALLVALFVFTGPLFSEKQEKHKKVDPFSIDVKALQGQTAVDLYATFSTSDPVKYPLPPSIKKFQIKIFSRKGKVAFVSNEKKLELVNNQIVSRIPGRFDNDTLRVVAHIKTPQKGDVELDKEWGRVRLRPDLKVASIQAPSQQNTNVPFSVEVLVQETNMQSPSTCSVSLYQEGSLIHTTANVAVAAGGNVSVVFGGLTYSSAGVQNYSAVISDVDPGDYDTTNNKGAFSITFANPVTNYDLQYSKFFYLDETISESGNEGNHREQNEENFTYEISNNNPPSISNDALVSAAYVIKKSDNSVIQGSFTNLTPSFSHDSTLYNATDIANNLSFTAVRTPNGVSSSIVRSLSNNIYYELSGGDPIYTEGDPTGPPTADFLNENTSLVVSLLTTIGNFPFGGSASVTITGSAVFLPPDVGSFEDNGITYITRSSYQQGSFSDHGVVDVPILPGASQRKEAKITLKRDDGSAPKEFQLNQNYPNPFNPTTMITFALPKNAFVSVKVYDMLGREVKTLLSDEMSAGIHAVEWRGDDNGGVRASSGTYLYRITADDFVSTKKMILMK